MSGFLKLLLSGKFVCVCVFVCARGETIPVNAIMHIVFECIAIYCHIAIFDRILVKRHFV